MIRCDVCNHTGPVQEFRGPNGFRCPGCQTDESGLDFTDLDRRIRAKQQAQRDGFVDYCLMKENTGAPNKRMSEVRYRAILALRFSERSLGA